MVGFGPALPAPTVQGLGSALGMSAGMPGVEARNVEGLSAGWCWVCRWIGVAVSRRARTKYLINRSLYDGAMDSDQQPSLMSLQERQVETMMWNAANVVLACLALALGWDSVAAENPGRGLCHHCGTSRRAVKDTGPRRPGWIQHAENS